jgi:3-methyl-2-oxobutanoate hydroxymethyltransferase
METRRARKTLQDLLALKKAGSPISALTCYDYPSACFQDEAGLDIIFVGDSAATNVLGHTHQNDLTVDDLRVLVRAVNRGVQQAYLLVDLPFSACQNIAAMRSAASQFAADGANGLKFEGFHPNALHELVNDGLEIWTHLGYLPQYHERPSTAATDPQSAQTLIQQARELEDAGAAGLILELVPPEIAQQIAQQTRFPVIGIGAGPHTDGQVQVWHDLVGLSAQHYRHAARLAETRELHQATIQQYLEKVARREIPAS